MAGDTSPSFWSPSIPDYEPIELTPINVIAELIATEAPIENS